MGVSFNLYIYLKNSSM